MFWMLWALGCVPKDTPPAAADDGVERFKVNVQAAVSAEGTESLPDELAALLGGYTVAADFVIEKALAREFRDGSLGYRVHFAEATATVQRGPGAAAPVALSLAGRTVELRAFPDGELLDVDLVSHVVGAERLMDVLDVVFPAISPAPPQPLAATAERTRAIHWPIRLERKRVMLSSVWATWQLADRDRDLLTLQYGGPWEVRGWEQAGEGDLRLQGAGRLDGTLLVRRSDSVFTRNTLRGERTLSLPYPGHEDLEQTTIVDLTAERL